MRNIRIFKRILNYLSKASAGKKAIVAVASSAMILSSIGIYGINIKAEETTPKTYETSLNEGGKKLTVTATDKNNYLPENSSFEVTKIRKYDDEYQKFKERVNSDKNKDKLEYSLYDIRFTSDGKEIEPDGNIEISMSWNREFMPDDINKTNNVSVYHMNDNGTVNDITKTTKIEKNENGIRNLNFVSDSFSVYGIVWENEDSDQIGNVELHYIDETGKELKQSENISSETLKTGDILTLSDKAENKEGVSAVNGYEYKEARMNSISGDIVKSVKTEKSENGYVLKYSTNETEYKDAAGNAITENKDNGADIYLIYQAEPKYTIHYISEAGTEIKDSVTKSASNIEEETPVDSFINGKITYKNEKYTFKTAYVDHEDDSTDAIRASVNDGKHQLEYRKNEWMKTDKKNADLYLVYSKDPSENSKLLTIHYIDLNGHPITDKNGNQMTKTVDASEWADDDTTWMNLFGLGDQIDGYKKDTTKADGHGIIIAKEGSSVSYPKKVITANRANYGTASYGDLTGEAFRYIRFKTRDGKREFQVADGAGTDNDTKAVSSRNVTINRAWAVEGDFDIYLPYMTSSNLTVTVHHIDSEGNKISDDTSSDVTSGNEMQASSFAKSITGYINPAGYLDRKRTESFDRITYNQTDEWKNVIDGKENDTLYKKIWLVYQKDPNTKDVTIHFTDENGKELAEQFKNAITVSSSLNAYRDKWNGSTLIKNAKIINQSKKVSSDYMFKGEYIGNDFKSDGRLANTADTSNAIQWKYDTAAGTWETAHAAQARNTPDSADIINGFITDIYWVYSMKEAKASDIHIHYVYKSSKSETLKKRDEQTGKVSDMTDSDGNPITFTSDIYTEFNESELGKNNSRSVSDAEINKGEDITVNPYVGNIDHDSKTYHYIGSFISKSSSDDITVDSPEISMVRIKNGKIQYMMKSYIDGNKKEAELLPLNKNKWSYTTDSGRTFILSLEKNKLYLNDSQDGNSRYSLSLTSVNGKDKIYSRNISDNDKFSTSYTVKKSDDSYYISVYQWNESKTKEIYQVYDLSSENNDENPEAELTIKNDMVYSGNIVAKVKLPEGYKVDSYEWGKSINDGDFEKVDRQKAAGKWNIAKDSAKRSYLNPIADSGLLNSKKGIRSVKYRVTVTYSNSEGQKFTISTDEKTDFDMPYYSQLKNGSFENPTGNFSWSNKAYKKMGGVWQSTGEGEGNHSYQDIEIVRSGKKGDSWNKNGYKFYSGEGSDGIDGAEDGEQFAELNAEKDGALYQDVGTINGEKLSYWLSHRARGLKQDSTPEYDTMYLVIIPTKLAMTSGSDNGKLNTQDELERFISRYTTYETELASKEEENIVYNDKNKGILIERISSNDQKWHNIKEINTYTAAANLTRFFFVAGPTAADQGSTSFHTHGNFIDNVGFSQTVPAPESARFNLTVSKTFKGIEKDKLQALAENTADAGRTFTLKINEFTKNGDKYIQSGDYSEIDDGEKYTSLNDATLTFRYDTDSEKIMPIAEDHYGNNILIGKSSGEVSEDDETGDITIKWELLNNYMDPDEKKYFKISEYGYHIDGYNFNPSNKIEILNSEDSQVSQNESKNTETSMIQISDRDSAAADYINTYEPGVMLPETGGRGTMIMYMIGTALVVLSLVLLKKRNFKKANKQ